MNTTKNLKLLSLMSFSFMLIMNAAANIIPFNNMTTKAVSDYYQNLFTPSAFTFSIWSIIYFSLIISIILNLKSTTNEPSDRKINQLFVISSVLNGFWMLAWHYFQIEIALLIMLGLFITLALINRITHKSMIENKNHLLRKIAFSLYFGWITIALVANSAALLSHYQFNLFNLSEPVWMVITLIIVTFISLYTIYKMKDQVYGAVVIWSLIGILTNHTSVTGYNNQYPIIIYTLIISLTFIGILELYLVKDSIQKRKPKL